jgi:hypothetical protein
MKKGVALLSTIMFIVAILGFVTLNTKLFKKATGNIDEIQFMIQSGIIVDDIIALFKKTPMLKKVKNSQSLKMLLDLFIGIPFALEDYSVNIALSNTKNAKFNINNLDENSSAIIEDIFIQKELSAPIYLIDIIKDILKTVSDTTYYNTEWFDENPFAHHGNIINKEHLSKIIDFYKKKHYDTAVNLAFFDTILKYENNGNSRTLDINAMSKEQWSLFVPNCGYFEEDYIENITDLNNRCGVETGLILKKLGFTSFFIPVVEVKIDISKENQNAHIVFDYNTNNAKVSNFEFIF